MYLIGSLGVVALVAFGTQSVLAGTMRTRQLVAFIILSAYLYEPVGTAASAESTAASRTRRGRTGFRNHGHAERSRV